MYCHKQTPNLASARLTPFPAHPSFEMYKNQLLFPNLLLVTLQCYKLKMGIFTTLAPPKPLINKEFG